MIVFICNDDTYHSVLVLLSMLCGAIYHASRPLPEGWLGQRVSIVFPFPGFVFVSPETKSRFPQKRLMGLAAASWISSNEESWDVISW